MAIEAQIYRDQRVVDITLYPGEGRSSIADDIDVPGFAANTYLWWYWDEGKLACGEREFLGIEIADVTTLSEADFAAIACLDLPTIDSPAYGLFDVTIADALRWAQHRALEMPARTAHAKAS